MSNTAKANHLSAVPDVDASRERVASSIRALAEIQGIKQAELAERAAIEPTALSKALKLTRNIRSDELERLADALSAPVNLLYVGGAELRQRAMAGVGVSPNNGPDDPGEQVKQSSPCISGNVLPLRRSLVPPVSPVPVAA